MKTLVVLIALVATIHTKPNLVLTPYHHPTTSILRNIWAPSHYIIPSYQAIPSLPTLNAAIHEKSATCVNNLNEAVPCAHTSIDDVNTRAIGALTLSDYDTEFTQDSKKILRALDMRNIKLVRDQSSKPKTETISWTQISRCIWGCEEDYRLVDYYQDGNRDRKFKVFIDEDTTPPNSFSTNGYNGKLHFGILTFSNNDGALFFVIHPNSWGPYQHRFKTNSLTGFVKNGLSAASGAAGGAATGAALGSIVPGLGTAIGSIVGAIGGAATAAVTDDYFGDYLRYIG